MAIKICPYCGKRISENAIKCPACGYSFTEAGEDITSEKSSTQKPKNQWRHYSRHTMRSRSRRKNTSPFTKKDKLIFAGLGVIVLISLIVLIVDVTLMIINY